MLKMKKLINKLSKIQKISFLIIFLSFILLISISIPTLGRFKNRNTIITVPTWDGSIANSYKQGNGSSQNPYVISNGSELAYFSNQLLENNYENEYFVLSNDIVLNIGVFQYQDENIKYILDNQEYYIDYYSNKYFDSDNNEKGLVNIFDSLKGFKGNLDGNSFTIYGLYITNQTDDKLALFTDLEGSVSNLYVQNAMIYGGLVTSGIASNAKDTSINNVLFEGDVIGRSTDLIRNENIKINDQNISINPTPTITYVALNNNIPIMGNHVINTSIKGNYEVITDGNPNISIKINNVLVTDTNFEINLGENILNEITIEASSLINAEILLTNLYYNVTYEYGLSSGIVGIGDNTIITNTINKASIYGYSTSGGLVGIAQNNLNIEQSYNIGNIKSQNSSGGLVGIIEKNNHDINILKSYNSGDMESLNIGGLIGVISNNIGSFTINKSFNISTTNYCIGTVSNTNVNVIDSYFSNGVIAIKNGFSNGNFISTSINNLKDKDFIINNLLFEEFIDFNDLKNNNKNVWIYEKESLPILYLDDINNPVANINVSVYSWNNLSYELNTVKLSSNLTFSIEETDKLNPIKEKYYYISNTSLTKESINEIESWIPYDGITQISEEGVYVITSKLIDYDDNITYINTDLLVLDLPGSKVKINFNDYNWSSLRDKLNYLYINEPASLEIEKDDLSNVKSIKYYLSENILSINELNKLSSNKWVNYSDNILINDIGKYIIYVQVKDENNYIDYINSDYIIFDGYNQNDLMIGRNIYDYLIDNPYITNKSIITLNTSYLGLPLTNIENTTHNLISNILLPVNSKITLIDHIKNKVYEYQIDTSLDLYNYNDSCYENDLECEKIATYPFTLFKEVGTGLNNKMFNEQTYLDEGIINENFTITLDLSCTDFSNNYDFVKLYVELHKNNVNVRPTLNNTIKKFNIYSTINNNKTDANLFLNTNYNGNEININTDSTISININSGLNYKYINGFKIIDTTFEDKEIGLSIKMVDSDGNIVDKEYLKNMIFKIGNNIYYPDSDNHIRINLKNGINDISKDLVIITFDNNSNLEEGLYYLKINNFASYDGINYDKLNNQNISIPIRVKENNFSKMYSFDVIMEDENRIIHKNEEELEILFKVLQGGSLSKPNIRISLYEKKLLTAYNQEYILVDLGKYVTNDLNKYTDNIYFISTNPLEYHKTNKLYNNFKLNLIPNSFKNGGYKFVFELYDDNKKIGTIEKYFIVK